MALQRLLQTVQLRQDVAADGEDLGVAGVQLDRPVQVGQRTLQVALGYLQEAPHLVRLLRLPVDLYGVVQVLPGGGQVALVEQDLATLDEPVHQIRGLREGGVEGLERRLEPVDLHQADGVHHPGLRVRPIVQGQPDVLQGLLGLSSPQQDGPAPHPGLPVIGVDREGPLVVLQCLVL